jgi:predicted RNA-binding protein YlxR (DUF448 family)
VPERTCIACRRKRPKWDLDRIVRTPEGAVEVDSRGKRSGRGAYLCRLRDCWEAGLTKKKIDHALKADIAAEQRAALLAHSATLPVGDRRADRRDRRGEEGVRA